MNPCLAWGGQPGGWTLVGKLGLKLRCEVRRPLTLLDYITSSTPQLWNKCARLLGVPSVVPVTRTVGVSLVPRWGDRQFSCALPDHDHRIRARMPWYTHGLPSPKCRSHSLPDSTSPPMPTTYTGYLDHLSAWLHLRRRLPHHPM